MIYAYFPLRFIAPVHFGGTQEGGNLTTHHMACSADTFFSALCQESAHQNKLQELLELVQSNQLRISSLFPWYREEGGRSSDSFHLYIPKPLISTEREVLVKSFSEMKQIASAQKKMKHLDYIRASMLKAYLSHKVVEPHAFSMPTIAVPLTAERVNCEGEKPLPYFVGAYQFVANAGLYFLIACESEDTIDFVKSILESLQYTGIGGKRSSGYGRFELEDEILMYDDGENDYADENALMKALTTESKLFMAISPFLPSRDEVDVIKTGTYKVLKRAGFIATREQIGLRKKDNIHMIKEGSCFSKALEGYLLQQHMEGVSYPIYRYGKGFFIGVDHDE